jgi:glycosyltransferase involved in cell wall biosynthesis
VPKLSVLLPCYNASGTLNEALYSLTCQTLSDFEIIAVDDGSTDGTLQMLQALALKDTRLRILPRSHEGIVSTLNAGLELCTALYVARMDADDCAHPERLEKQASFLDAHPEVGVVSCWVAGFPAGQVRQGFTIYMEWLNSLLRNDDIRREIFVESPLPHPSLTIRRELLQQVGGYQDHGWAEDYDLLLRLYLAGARFAKLPEVLLEWREHPQRLTRTDSRYSLENFLRAKAFYLTLGPLAGRDGVIIWGAGMVGRRLGKQLARLGAPLVAYIDIDPRKIGRTRRGLPILPPDALPNWWGRFANPVILTAVGARGARPLIRQRLIEMGFQEGQDWWSAA